MFRLVTQYVMLHCVVLIIWLFETRFLVALLGWVWICVFFFYHGEVFEKITSCFIWSRNRFISLCYVKTCYVKCVTKRSPWQKNSCVMNLNYMKISHLLTHER